MASTTLTFDDEFDSLSLHRTWQAGDNWQLIAPDSTDGRGGPNWGEGGSQWWVNPYNPSTPANDIYSASNGQLNLSLLPTPGSEQAYIDQQAGTHLPYVGGLLNNSPTNYQHYGLWETSMAVDRVPGFSAEVAVENVQLTGHWPPQLNIGVSTDGGGNQTLQAAMHYDGTSADYSQAIDGTQQHSYGIDWEADAITFYFDKAQVLKVANPGGVYQTDQMFAYLYTGANYSAGTDTDPPLASLPASAYVDYFRVYAGDPPPAKPSSGTTISTSSATGTIVNDDSAKRGGSQGATLSATTVDPTLDQMQFIPLNSSAGTDTLSASNPGQILTDTAGTDMLSGLSGLDKPSDLLPEAPHLRTPMDHSAGAPIIGIDFGIHHSTGNFAMIDAAQHPTPPL